MISYQIILLIFEYLQKSSTGIITNDKIYIKNINIRNFLKIKDIFKIAKLNKTFYIAYSNQFNKCYNCNIPILVSNNHTFNCNSSCNY